VFSAWTNPTAFRTEASSSSSSNDNSNDHKIGASFLVASHRMACMCLSPKCASKPQVP
jgi:hypothetical protein